MQYSWDEIHAGTPIMKSPTGNPVIALPCACANLRRAARIVTQLYEQEMRPTGLHSTQFTLLQALTIAPPNISQGRLAEVLGMDSTTLTRTLALLKKMGWIQLNRGEDRRQLRLALTPEGKRTYRQALPHWKRAQKRLRKSLGESHWNAIMESTTRTAGVAPES